MMVLITGSNSLLGSTLVKKLAADGERVRCLDRERPREAPPAEFIEGDILDENLLAKACGGIETVVHLMDVKGTRRCSRRYMRRINVKGVKMLLNAARAAGVKRFVFVSSYEVYGPKKEQPVVETAECKPATRYGKHKRKAEALCRNQRLVGPMEVVIVRPAPIIGPRTNNPIALITLLMAMGMEEANRVYVAGNGENRFQILHPDDAAEAIRRILRTPRLAGKIYNLGSDDVPTQMEQIQAVKERARLDAPIRHLSTGRTRLLSVLLRPFKINYLNKGHVMYLLTNLILDCAAAKADLGWKPTKGNVDIIVETIEWYRREKL